MTKPLAVHGGLVLNSTVPNEFYGFTVRDGKIGQLFTSDDAFKNYVKRNDCDTLDLQGRAVLPGQVDAHINASFFSRFHNSANFAGVSDAVTAKTRLEATTPDHNGFLVATNWQDNKLALTIETISQWFPNTPVIIHNASFHGGMINRKGLENIEENGGLLNHQNGLLLTTEYEKFLDITRPIGQPFGLNILAYQDSLLAAGITSAHDLLVMHADELQVFEILAKAGRLKLHWRLYVTDPKLLRFKDNLKEVGVNLMGVKLFLDGAYGTKTAWQDKAHAYPDGSMGKAKLSTEDVIEIARQTTEQGGTSLALHCIGFKACQQAIRIAEKLKESIHTRDLTLRVQHFQTANEVMFRLAHAEKMFVNMQPGFSQDVITYKDRLPVPEHINAIATAKPKLGKRLSFGSDGMPLGYLANIKHALFPPMPHQKAGRTLADVLPLFSLHPARITGDQHALGCFKPGLSADFVILNKLPTSEKDYKLCYVEETWAKGVCAYKRK